MHLVLLDRNEELLAKTVADLTAATGEEPLAVPIDVRDADAVSQAFTDGLARFGKLDTLVNVAGGTFKADFVDTNVRGWDAVIRMNFGWLLHTTNLAANQMKTQGHGGSIISITSIEGHRAAPGYAVYAGMKGAVTNFAHASRSSSHPIGSGSTPSRPTRRPPRACRWTPTRGSSPPGSRWGGRGPTATSAARRCSWRPTSPSTSPARRCTPTAARGHRRVGGTGPSSAGQQPAAHRAGLLPMTIASRRPSGLADLIGAEAALRGRRHAVAAGRRGVPRDGAVRAHGAEGARR